MEISIGFIDIAIIGAYIGYLIYIIFRSFSNPAGGDDSDYILAGRQLTLPAFVATLVSTWYGGILGVGEFTWLYGISNWVVFGLPYYIFALMFALFFARRIRKTNLLTLPDQFEFHFGKKAASFSGFLLFIITLPAPYLLMLGYLISLITGFGFILSTVFGAVFSLAYIFSGGFSAIVRTDKVQFLLMFGGFIFAFLILNFREYPFWDLSGRLPETHLTLTGGNSVAYILSWFIIAAQTLIDPNFYQRVYAAETPATARKGILISILFWILFDFLTTTVGLYARALFPDLETPALSFPLLGSQYFPPVIKGLFFTGLLATIMSSVDSFSFVSAVSLGRDTFSRLRAGKTGRFSRRNIERALIITSLLSLTLVFFERSIVDLWYQLGSVTVPSLLLPILYARFSRRRNPENIIFTGMAVTTLAVTILLLFPALLPFALEPVFAGILLQSAFIGFSYLRSEKITS